MTNLKLTFVRFNEPSNKRGRSGNQIYGSFDRETIVLYTHCRSSVAYFAQAFQPHFLKTHNHQKLGKILELRTSFTSAVRAWGKREDSESILALTVARETFDELLVKAIQGNYEPSEKREAGFGWEKGKDIFGSNVESNNLILYLRNEALRHFSNFSILDASFQTTVYLKAVKSFITSRSEENVMIPFETKYKVGEKEARALQIHN